MSDKEKEKSMLSMKTEIGDIKRILKNTNKIKFFFDNLHKHQQRQKELRDELKIKVDNIQKSELKIVIIIIINFKLI